MTQQEYENKIKELQDELEKLKAAKIAESGKRWKPDKFEDYWLVDSGGGISKTYNSENNTCDEYRCLIGNCFETQEEAEEYKKQIEYTARYKNYIEEHSEPIDWEDEDQDKYYAEYRHEDEDIYVDWYNTTNFQGTIYASSEQIIKDAIKEIGEDNFKKYVLGVK